MISLLKNGQYLRLWLAQVVAELGDGITSIVVVLSVARLSDSPIYLSAVIFVQLLPVAMFSVLLGPFADRYSKRVIMVVSDVYRGLILLGMILAQDNIYALLVLIFLHGIGTALFEPARSSSIPKVVGEERISEAVSLSQGTFSAMLVIAPAIGGILVVFVNSSLIFTIGAVTFAVSAMLLSTISSLGEGEQVASDERESHWQLLKEGIREVTGITALRFLLILLVPISIIIGILNANLAATFLLHFKVPEMYFGYLRSVFGVGAVIGALLGPVLLRRFPPGQLLTVATALFGFWLVLIWPLDYVQRLFGIAPIFIWNAVSGMIGTCVNVPIGSLFLTATPDSFRGRGSALMQSTVEWGQLAGILLGGWLAQFFGVLLSSAIAGMMLMITVVIFPQLQGYRALHGTK
ncbi:MFS transporter [Numidum massiliense]|uniref:MFS transporter n=1 Tax=Numidum massiliense TaxID=1522315 RepID=UPI0006D59A41|nr:MFS transporter [Numidum massiliense]